MRRAIERSGRAAGFTLLELMVALGVGGIAITSIYAIAASTTRQFRQQEQVANTQSAVRFAMTQLKRDIGRAGYLSTPNASPPLDRPPQTCGLVDSDLDNGNATGRLAAFSQYSNDVTITPANDAIRPLGPPATRNPAADFSADQITLLGNYETSAEYPGVTVLDPNRIAIDQDWHGFQRDFTNWYVPGAVPPVYQPALFEEAFRVGRLIRIQTTRRLRHFAIIQSVPGPLPSINDDVQITFQPAIPASCMAEATGGWVAPVSVIQLSVTNMVGDFGRGAAIGPIGQLMRREMDPRLSQRTNMLPMNPAAIVPSFNSRSILDFVVSFNLSFTMTDDTGPNQPDAYIMGNTVSDNSVNQAPERIRAVTIDVAARLPFQDPTLPWSLNTCRGGRCFEVFHQEKQPGAARVRHMRAEVFVPNVAYEGY
jgi:prepilin-type N-terminal cleavage/methylation domain-containing protein